MWLFDKNEVLFVDGFELRIHGVRSDRFAICATTTVLAIIFYIKVWSIQD